MLAYETFMKHAAKVTKSIKESVKEKNPALIGVKHFANGDAVVSDAIRIYLAKRIHDRTDEAIITPDGKKVKTAYPDISRFFREDEPGQEVKLDLPEILTATDIIYSVGRLAKELVICELKEDHIRFVSHELKIFYSLPIFQFNVYMNVEYLLDALKLIKASNSKTVVLKFYDRLKPLRIENEDGSLLILILPIRMY
ncbi:hypothetical protein B0I26_10368 [Anoxybacillus vitaminiphilus]|uniref:Uncharacterized protein n=2 Tax=Paranoxybacillus vitaminiphilus TaxID=581036 RepID=A0A327YLP5_9BACL|nr:hypothetical protein B0I26_10368 [Anoxybacillus vitaminiphilus]